MDERAETAELVYESIENQVLAVLASNAFQEWIESEKPREGDLVILNNSFLHREGIANRSKSIRYLSVPIGQVRHPSPAISVLKSNSRINNRFKRISVARVDDYEAESLKSAVDRELIELGT